MSELKECTDSYLNKQERMFTRMVASMDESSPNRALSITTPKGGPSPVDALKLKLSDSIQADSLEQSDVKD